MPASTLTRSFRHPNYRLYVAGQLVSLTGTWMQNVAQAWLIYRLTDSSLALGVAGFASQVPVFLLALLGGVLADRYPKRALLLACSAVALVQAAVLAGLTLAGRVEVWQVVLMATLLGVVNAVEIPTRHSFVVEMVGKDDLHNAIALNSSMFHLARILGPSIAGVLVGLVGEGWCFAVNALSFLAVMASLASMRLEPVAATSAMSGVGRHLWEGIAFAWRTPRVRAILALIAVASSMGASYLVLLPVFAGTVFGQGAGGLGMLTASAGLGSLAGALLMASRREARGLRRLAVWSCAGLGCAMALFARAPVFWAAAVLLAPAGFALMVLMASCNTMLQLAAPDGLRGRVMALYSMLYMGMAPFGALAAGWLADVAGAQAAMTVMGACCLLGALGPGRAIVAAGGTQAA